MPWFWALHSPSKPGTLRISNQVATLETAKAEFEASWKQWKAWAKMEVSRAMENCPLGATRNCPLLG
jgi:hypothetical protein